MDIRLPVIGILVGGTPVPGINGIISAAVIEAVNLNHTVIGFSNGFKFLRRGISSHCAKLSIESVSNIHTKGGCLLKTSKDQLSTKIHCENVLTVLKYHRISKLLVIGGFETAKSLHRLSDEAKAMEMLLEHVYIPVSIFMDLPLPRTSQMFGFSSAREFGVKMVSQYYKDAKSNDFWYIINAVGAKTGHFCFSVGKSSSATLAVIQEQFKGEKVKFSAVVDHVDACVMKRQLQGKNFGTILLSEGIVDRMDRDEVAELFGDVDEGHHLLATMVAQELGKRMERRNGPAMKLIARDLGFEVRCNRPNAGDKEISMDLGYGAISALLNSKFSGLVAMEGDRLVQMDLIGFCERGKRCCGVDVENNTGFTIGHQFMFSLKKRDLEDTNFLERISRLAGMSVGEFIGKFRHVAM